MNTETTHHPEKPQACPPVLFLIFNRPEPSRRVFECIREARPSHLFIAADGPRPEKPGEAELCEQTRKTVHDLIDWPCEVNTLYHEKNLGCKRAVNSAITWFFEHVGEGIILEDDCLPNPTFFSFCEEMLKRYRDEKSVMHICGANNVNYTPETNDSYYFSHFAAIWGWATWKRAWELNDPELENWPELKRSRSLDRYCLSDAERVYFEENLDAVYADKLDTWDYGWALAIVLHEGLCVFPRKNLVRNIGFGKGAVHTINPFDKLRFRKAHTLPFPLIHPDGMTRDEKYDAVRGKKYYEGKKIRKLIKKTLLRLSGLCSTKKT